MFRPEERSALRVLYDELGLFDALRVGGRVQRKVFAGQPFDDLPAPEDESERLSREQIGPAIVLYRELQEIVSRERAFEIVERVAVDGAVEFLARSIGRLQREELIAMGDDERREFVESKGEKFFNADVRWEEIDETQVVFTVTHCRFPPLCEAAGAPELAPLFCKGDAEFFGGVESDVELDRPRTIAEGADTCLFHIYLTEPDDGRA